MLFIKLLDDVLVFEGVAEGGEHRVDFSVEGLKFSLHSSHMKLVVDEVILLFEDDLLECLVLIFKSCLPFRVRDRFCEAGESVVDGSGLRSLHLLVCSSCDALVTHFLAEGVVFVSLEFGGGLEVLDIMEQALWDVRWNHLWTKTLCGGARGAGVIGSTIGVVSRRFITVLVTIRLRGMGRRRRGIDQRVIRSGGWRRRSVWCG